MERSAMEQVIHTYADMVYRLAYAYMHNPADADDIFQDVFLKYAEKAPDFAEEEHRKAWLIRVTVNQCRNHYRSAWWKRIVPLDLAARASIPPPDDHELHDAMGKLPAKYRTVIHLYYYENYTSGEIAELLDLRAATVRSRLARGRSLLEKILKGDQDV